MSASLTTAVLRFCKIKLASVSCPVRMCVSCRVRASKGELNKFGFKGEKVIKNNLLGRSFYICNECLTQAKTREKLAKKMKINFEEL